MLSVGGEPEVRCRLQALAASLATQEQPVKRVSQVGGFS